MLNLSFLKSYSECKRWHVRVYLKFSRIRLFVLFLSFFFFSLLYLCILFTATFKRDVIRNTIEFYKALKGKNHAQHRLHII